MPLDWSWNPLDVGAGLVPAQWERAPTRIVVRELRGTPLVPEQTERAPLLTTGRCTLPRLTSPDRVTSIREKPRQARHDPPVRAYDEHRLARDKTKMHAHGRYHAQGPARHLLHPAGRDDQLFDGHKVYASPRTMLAPPASNAEVVCSQT